MGADLCRQHAPRPARRGATGGPDVQRPDTAGCSIEPFPGLSRCAARALRAAALAAWLCAWPLVCAAAADSLPEGRWAVVLLKGRPVGFAAAAAENEAQETDGAGAAEDKGKAAAPAEASDVELVFERTDGAWLPLFSAKERLFGLVERVESDGALSVLVLFDAMGRSNNLFKERGDTSLLAYRVSPRAAADGTLTGEWSSPKAGKGTLTGRVLPIPPAARRAPSPGEHPRFLLRAGDLPALKAKAATPFGQMLVKHMDKDTWSRSGRAVGLGLIYRLTGDRTYAQRAQELVLQDIRGGWWDIIGPVHDPPHKVMEAVYTWDLIHDACEPAFRDRLLHLLRANLRFLDSFCDMDRGNGHPHSNWSAQFQTGVGMAALGLLADPSDRVEPDLPDAIPTLSPPASPMS